VTSREITLVLLSAFLHALWNLSTKGSRNPLAFALLLYVVAAVGLVLVAPWVAWGEITAGVWVYAIVSSALHALYFYWLTRSYQHADLSVVYPIARSTPAFVPFLAIPLLGERLSLLGAGGIAVVVAGIWLVHAEGFRWKSPRDPGVRFALLTLTATVVYSILDKEGMAHFSRAAWSGPIPRAIVYYLVVESLSLVVFVPVAWQKLRGGVVPKVARAEAGTVLRAAVFALASYSLILEAFRTANVSYVVAARQVSVLFAVALGMFWLGERPSRVRIAGALATVVGVAMVAWG
jgi:drug/metabolite transporter (DMT)-like permease